MNKPLERSFFARYRDLVLFNKNLIIAGACGLVSSAVASQLYALYDSNVFADSLVALATDYGAYLPIFGFLFYRDNKAKYIDESGRKNTRLIRADLKKLFAAFSISELVYTIVRVAAQYQLLSSGAMSAYEASIVGELVAWAVFLLAINLMTKLVRLFKKPGQV